MANTITTGELAKHFGIGLNADFVKDTLGFRPAEVGRAGHPRWDVNDVPRIGEALKHHLTDRIGEPVVESSATPKPAKKTAVKPPVDEDDDL